LHEGSSFLARRSSGAGNRLVWGTNFVVIRVGLNALPLCSSPPCVSFSSCAGGPVLAQTKASWSNLALYGVCIGLFQFGLLFIAMKGHISPGLASLVIQMQVSSPSRLP